METEKSLTIDTRTYFAHCFKVKQFHFLIDCFKNDTQVDLPGYFLHHLCSEKAEPIRFP